MTLCLNEKDDKKNTVEISRRYSDANGYYSSIFKNARKIKYHDAQRQMSISVSAARTFYKVNRHKMLRFELPGATSIAI